MYIFIYFKQYVYFYIFLTTLINFVKDGCKNIFLKHIKIKSVTLINIKKNKVSFFCCRRPRRVFTFDKNIFLTHENIFLTP